jgi:ribose 5-phosphate isomerase B
MNIAIGADHRGYHCKEYIKEKISSGHDQITWLDVGAASTERSDYPIFAQLACKKMLEGQAEYAVLICGSGVGMAIVANRFARIYAAVAWNEKVARLSKEHDNANVLVLPSDFISKDQAVRMVRAWSRAYFLEGRYRERLNLIDTMEI